MIQNPFKRKLLQFEFQISDLEGLCPGFFEHHIIRIGTYHNMKSQGKIIIIYDYFNKFIVKYIHRENMAVVNVSIHNFAHIHKTPGKLDVVLRILLVKILFPKKSLCVYIIHIIAYTYYSVICSHCVRSHLGVDALPDYTLRFLFLYLTRIYTTHLVH